MTDETVPDPVNQEEPTPPEDLTPDKNSEPSPPQELTPDAPPEEPDTFEEPVEDETDADFDAELSEEDVNE